MSNQGPAPPSQDVVGVFDSNFNQVCVAARPIRASIKPIARLAKHPIESGSTITDNRILLPIEIHLALVLTPAEFRDTYQEIKNAYQSLAPLYVQTKADSYPNMYIEEMPHDETVDLYDTIAVGLKLTQVIFADAQFAQLTAVKNPTDASTVKTGQQDGQPATPAQTSSAYELYRLAHP